MKYSKALLTAIVMLMATVNLASGQVSSTVQATGTVLEPITVSNATNLAFGTSIFPGISKSITISDAGAAQFDIDGETGKEVSVTFSTLPQDLTHDVDGTTTLPISFSTTDGGHNTTDDPGTATTFDPSAAQTTTLGATSGLLYVYLGGTVTPTSTQKSGAYSANITVDFAYTGN